VASNVVEHRIDCAILLATPVLRYDQNKKNNTESDLYLPKSIDTLFLFYSMLDFVQSTGSLTEEFKRRYGPINGIDLYTIHLLLNGQEPTHSALYTQVIEDHILQLCQKIKNLYKKNKNLVANIAPTDKNVDQLIAIRKYDPIESNPLAGRAIDTLWQNWENFTYAQNETDENALSEKNRLIFNNFYHKDFIDVTPILDRSIRGAEQEVCVRAIGKFGSGLAFVPEKSRAVVSKLCCPYEEFKREHPNATRALSCAQDPAPGNNVLTAEENNDLCMNVIGVPGRSLALLTPAAKADLKVRCCSPQFQEIHAQAAKAIGC
jgi:hypothetical protein